MPSTLTYPGVYIEELPSGVHTIVGVATLITAFIGTAPRGPVNQATTIGGFDDYERTFGGLDKKNPMGFAVRDFFLKERRDGVRLCSWFLRAIFETKNKV